MKKILCLILTVVFLLLCVGCSTPTQTEETPDTGESSDSGEDVVLPPTRIGKGGMRALLAENYTFEEAMEEAEVVARVQIGNWLGEKDEAPATYFEAKVLQCFKGDIPENITLSQIGNSKCTMKLFPLFTYGNELFLFLASYTHPIYESSYRIVGVYPTVFDVLYDESDTRYYAPRFSSMGDSIDISVNYGLRGDVHSEVYAKAVESDPIVSELRIGYFYLFSEADMMSLIEDCKTK